MVTKNIAPPPSRSALRIRSKIHLVNTLLLFVHSCRLYVYLPPHHGSLDPKSYNPRRRLLTRLFFVFSIIYLIVFELNAFRPIYSPPRGKYLDARVSRHHPLSMFHHIGGYNNSYVLYARSFRLAPWYTWFEHSSEDLEYRVIYFNGGYPYKNCTRTCKIQLVRTKFMRILH